MAKQLNVNLAFSADTSQAKSQIMELQTALAKVASMKLDTSGVDSGKFREASNAAKELSIHLNNAFNAQTGKLDLSKLDKSLKTSSTNVTELSNKLLNAGNQGQQAFIKLAQTISAADRPVVTLNAKLNGLFTTLANTARWQLSSSILHGFMGAYQQAMGYVKDLNTSLTDIRIVTGKSIDDMSRFAVEANKAAKALSTTTNEYAQASLIFFQQGLNEEEVAKRAAVTTKLANASGQSAQIVSDQLTAVWNNFYDGSKSLEYYADVLTALGAATASSTDEIAGGLEKFAAIGETIGLSYEYAAAALATITSNTRQSEEVVGTALKTIFARIQGLKLGETLEDGVDLNKYSEALATVGVEVLDATGELRKADDILKDMAATWDTLSKAQQTALAQTVGGIRQYNQIVALMENWDDGDSDSMVANLGTAYESEGTLQKQADTYAESWEAARDRVQASLESIYKDVLNDEFFIDIANGFSGLLDSLDAFIDGVGGIKTVIMGIGSFFLASFANKVQPALMNLKHTFSVVFQSAEKQAQNLTTEMNKGISDTLNSSTGMNFSDSSKTALKNAMDMNIAKGKLQSIEHNLNDTEKQRYNLELQLLQADQDAAQAVADKITKRKEEIALLAEAFDYEQSTKSLENSRGKEEQDLIDNKKAAEEAYLNDPSDATKSSLTKATSKLNEHRVATERLVNAREQYAKSLYDAYNTEMQTTQGAIESSTKLLNIQEMMPEVVQHYTKALAGMQSQPLETQRETFARLKDELEQIVGNTCPDLQKAMDAAFKSRSADAFKKNISGVMKALKEAKIPAKDLERILSSMGQGKNVKQIREQYKALGKETTDLANRQKQLKTALEEFNPKHTVTGIERITQAAAGLGQVAMLAQSCRSIFSAWGNDDLSIGEKLTTTFMSLSMIIPSAIGAFKSFNTALGGTLTSMIEAAVTQSMYNKSLASSAAQELKATAIKRLSGSADAELTKKALAKLAVKKGLCTEEQKELFVEQLLAGQKGKNVIATMAETAMIKLNTAAQNGNKIAKLALVAAEKVASIFGVTLAATKTTETGAVVANTAAWYANPIMWIALIIVGVVAALAALVAIIASVSKALSDAYNKDAIAAEKAAKAADDLKKSYEEAKQAYEDMIAAMDEYKSARDALDDLTEGTQEYKDALQEANRAALELINTYPEYFGEGTYHWEGDQLVVDEEAMNAAKEAGAKKEGQAYSAMVMGQAEAKQAKNKADETALRRQMAKETVTDGDVVISAIAGAILGSIAGSFTANPFGIYQGAALGAATVTARENAQLEKSDAINKAALAYQEDKNLFSGTNSDEIREKLKVALEIEDDAIIDALIANKESIIELSNNIEAANELEKVAAQQSAAELISKDSKLSSSKYADDLIYMAGSKYQDAHGQAQDEILQSMQNKAGLKQGAQQYFDNQGISSKSGFEIEKYDAKNGTVKYSYLDEEGERQEKEVTREEMSQSLAVIEAQTEMTDACYTLIEAFETLDENIAKTGSALDEGMKAFLATGDTSQLTKEQYEAMSKMTSEQMIDYLGDLGITDQTVTEFGYDDMSAFIEDMDLTSTGDKWNQYSDVTSLDGAQDITLQSAENIHNNIAEITDFFGEAVGQQMLDLSEGFAGSLDEASRAEFWKQLGQIQDFSNAEEWEKFIESMKESGDLTEEEAELLENYADSAKLAAKATKELNFDSLAESVKALSEVMDTISEGERNISNEQFETLEAQGIDTSKFAKTIDGWRYLGDTGDFATELADGIKSQFKEAQENFKNLAAQAEQASQNLTQAEAAAAEARAAAEQGRDQEKASLASQVESTTILKNMMQSIVDNVVGKIKSAWDWICDIVLKVYDVFVNVYNAIGKGLTDAWNGFITWLEGMLNDIADFIVELLEFFGVDTSEWEGFSFDTVEFEEGKTSEDLVAEEEEKTLGEKTQALRDGIDDLVNSIEASADYLSEDELESGKTEAEQGFNQAQADYDAAVAEHGEGSAQAEYYKALKESFEKQVEAYDNAILSKSLGEGIDPEVLESYTKNLMENNKELANNEELAKKVAKAQIKFEKEIKNIQGILENNKDALDDSQKGTTEYYEACKKLASGLNKVFGDNVFDSETVAENLDDIKLALEGDAEAYNRLQSVAVNNILQEQLENIPQTLQDTINAVSSVEGINVGDLIIVDENALDVNSLAYQLSDMYNQAYNAAIAGGKSTAEAIDYANQLMEAAGFEAPEMVEKEVILTGDIPDGWTPQADGSVVTTDASGNTVTVKGVKATKTEGGTYTYTQTMLVPKEKTGFTKMSETIKPSGNGGGGGGGGGGGSQPKKTSESRKKKSDMVERYKEINDQLEETERLMNKNSILAEGLWGPKRIAKLKENIKLMEQENRQLKDKYELSKQYLQEDADALLEAGQAAGVSFNIDAETGLITNYTDIMTQLYNEREALLDSFGDTMDEAEAERLAEFDKKIEEIEGAYEQYETTLDEKKDAEEEHLQKVLDIQTAYYNLLNEELEINLSINEKDLKLIEYYLDKMSDDFYSMAEAAALMIGSLENGQIGGQMAEYFQNIQHYQDYAAELQRQHTTINPETGETYINDQQYEEGLQKLEDGILGELSNAVNLDKEMMNYYREALEAANAELDEHIERMEHLNSVLEHYSSILDMSSLAKDYETMNTILQGQIELAENKIRVSEATLDFMSKQLAAREDEYQAALNDPTASDEEIEMRKEQYEAALDAYNEAEEQHLADVEAYAEAAMAILENNIEKFARDLEKSLTGGTSFDQMNTSMERLVSLHDEYLTTTNKIYETNKLMRTVQQEIDKTSNTVAKNKMKQFIQETQNLQNQSKLSQYELDIQQAKYDLLVAEIALEEAQHAKSQVRLSRDSEGNFGYIYTANQEEVQNAEQEYLDAQNKLYNLGLEGANDYVQKYQETMSEMYDTLAGLAESYRNGEFESEAQYQAAVDEATQYYYEKLDQYSYLHYQALQTDSAVATDYILSDSNLATTGIMGNTISVGNTWKQTFLDISGFSDAARYVLEGNSWSEYNAARQSFEGMTQDGLSWKDKIVEYVGNVKGEFQAWTAAIDKEVDPVLDDMKSRVGEVVTASEDLVTTIIGDENTEGVIDALQDEMDKVTELTGAYADLRKSVLDAIKAVEQSVEEILNPEEEEQPEETPPTTPSTTTDDSGADSTTDPSALATEAQDLVEKVHKGIIGGKGGWINSARAAGYSEEAITLALRAFNDSKPGAGYSYYYDKALELIGSYDTGGYTGNWEGSYGKLALLHKKELILNEGDTSNFLASLEVLERILKVIDLQSANAQYLGNLSSPTFGSLQKEILEQNVHIDASFPNVTDKNEIEEAFKDLVNLASQYTNRK